MDINFRERLMRLPLRATVALAGRCALRLRPYLHSKGQILFREAFSAIDDSILVATDFASTGVVDPNAHEIGAAASDGGSWVNLDQAPSLLTSRDAQNALSVMSVMGEPAMCVFYIANIKYREGARHAAALAAESTIRRPAEVGTLSNPYVQQCALDFLEIAKFFADGDKPIDLSEAGPLGPLWDEYPDWWPDQSILNLVNNPDAKILSLGAIARARQAVKDSDTIEGDTIKVTIDIPEGLSDEEALEVVRRLTKAADDHHRLLDGVGLEAETRFFRRCDVPEGATS